GNEEMEPIAWGTEREKTFRTLKAAVLSAPGLGFSDYSKSFKLYCDEAKGVGKGVLVQTLGPHERPVAYFSSTLDSVTKGTPFCIRAIATAAEMVEKTRQKEFVKDVSFADNMLRYELNLTVGKDLQPPFLFKNSKLIMQTCQKQWGTLTC
uniref:Reverse transcriptase/retrotransposon-derived protein RNase H-like domain-containing protein n=1 Tax=Aquila chrysaetos chrysaetos TaxID=223781 RepID=A0A663FEV9_AQUCH